jgi:hypothetical protein
MQKPIRVGIAGCGNAAVFHYASFQRVTGIPVKVVGVTSLQKHGVRSLPSGAGSGLLIQWLLFEFISPVTSQPG